MKHVLVRLVLLSAVVLFVVACASQDSGTVTEETPVPGASTGEGTITPGTNMTGPSASVPW